MRFVRFVLKDGKPFEMKGIAEESGINRIHGSLFQGFSVSNEIYSYDAIRILPPPASVYGSFRSHSLFRRVY